MNESKKLKDILAGVALKFGAPKGRVWTTVRRSTSGFGRGWNECLYTERQVSADEAKKYNLPATSIMLSFDGDSKPCLAIYPSTYKDGNQVEHATVCASSLSYLERVGMKKIEEHGWEPGDDFDSPQED